MLDGRLISVGGKVSAGWASATAICWAIDRALLALLAWRAEA